MIWKTAVLYKPEESGKDALGNVLFADPSPVWTGSVRYTPWAISEQALMDHDVIKDEQRFAVPCAYKDIKEATEAVLNGIRYKITDKAELSPRWCSITVKVYKHG